MVSEDARLIFQYLRSSQIDELCRFVAAERPPHLKAIAPWEGVADHYREMLGRGGIPNPAFVDYRGSGYCGAYSVYALTNWD